MPASSIPAIFERIPDGLFGPLAGPLAPLYWSVLSQFYQFEFEREPFHIEKSVAIGEAESILRTSPLWRERKELLLQAEPGAAIFPVPNEELADLHREGARRIVAKLEQAGWFHFEYRSEWGQILNFYPYAARILNTLVGVARDEQPVFQGYAHSIATLLKPESFVPKPGIAIREAKRHTLELVRELKILNRNIFQFTQRLVQQIQTASGVLEEGMDRYRQAVQANYHRLKTVDNLYKWRGDILLRLDAVERDASSLASAAAWYAEQLNVDIDSAKREVAQDLHIMRTQFETLPAVTDDIDRRNARFSGVALRKLNYLLRQDKRIEGQLQMLIEALAHDQAVEVEFELFRCELLSGSFLYTVPVRRKPAEQQPLAIPQTPDRDRLRAAVASVVRSPFARACILAYVDAVLEGRRTMPLGEFPLDSDDDYVRRIFIIAFGLDGAPYTFRAENQSSHPPMERKGRYGYPRGEIERRGRRR